MFLAMPTCNLSIDSVTIWTALTNFVTKEKKPPWPGRLVAAISIEPMGVTTFCTSCADNM